MDSGSVEHFIELDLRLVKCVFLCAISLLDA